MCRCRLSRSQTGAWSTRSPRTPGCGGAVHHRDACPHPGPGVRRCQVCLKRRLVDIGLIEANEQRVGLVEQHVEEQTPRLGARGRTHGDGLATKKLGASGVGGAHGDRDGIHTAPQARTALYQSTACTSKPSAHPPSAPGRLTPVLLGAPAGSHRPSRQRRSESAARRPPSDHSVTPRGAATRRALPSARRRHLRPGPPSTTGPSHASAGGGGAARSPLAAGAAPGLSERSQSPCSSRRLLCRTSHMHGNWAGTPRCASRLARAPR